MPTFSIIIPTSRIGGLDVLFDGLINQSCYDFELILIDNLLEYRKELLDGYVKTLPFKLKYSKPFGEIQFPYANYTGSINTGIHLSEGKYILISADYVWFSKYEIENRILAHNEINDYRAAIFGNYIKYQLPTLCSNLWSKIYAPLKQPSSVNKIPIYEEQQEKACLDYIEDLNKGLFQQHMFSIFDTPFSEIQINKQPTTHIGYTDYPNEPKQMINLYTLSLKNDSFSRQLLLEANGLNEEFNGGHGMEDVELTSRLKNKHKTKFYWFPHSIAHIIDITKFIYCRLHKKQYLQNNELYQQYSKNLCSNYEVNNWNIETGLPK